MATISPRDLQARLEQAAAGLEAALQKAEDASIAQALGEAKALSSGTTTSAQLADMDHPFATRHGSPRADTSVINEQTGDFLRDWKSEPSMPTSGGLSGRIFNDNSVAGFLDAGTSRMFARTLTARVKAAITPIRQQRISDTLNKLLKGK